MKGKLAWLIGIGLWMVSLIVVLGSLVLSLSEGGLLRPNPSEQQLVATTPADYVATPEESEMVLELPPTATFFPSPTRTATETATPVPTCAYPAGWIVTTLPAGVSLETLALQYGLTPEQILQANCLTAESLGTKSELYLPAPTVTPTATETERPRKPKATQTAGSAKCGPPASWVIYIIQKGDTLYSIAVQTGTTVVDLQWANCLGNSTMVRAGQKLYVPRLPQGKPPAATQKPPKPPKATIPSGPGVTPIVVTPLPTASP